MLLRVFHIFLAINILLSSSGITLFEHLCQMEGRTASIFEHAGSCCGEKLEHQPDCYAEKKITRGLSFKKKPCCVHKTQFYKTTTQATTLKELPAPDLKFTPAIHHVWCWVALDRVALSTKILRFYHYKPPPIITDIRVVLQSFLC